MHKGYDAANAFGSGRKVQLEEGVRARLEEAEDVHADDVSFVAEAPAIRRCEPTVIAQGADAEAATRSGSGGFTGDASAPEIFMLNYHPAIQRWANFEESCAEGATMIKFDKFAPIDASI